MSANFSIFESLYPQLSLNSSRNHSCLHSRLITFTFSALSITYILLLPVFILVLYLGFQRWRTQRSVSTDTTSHSDIITFHAIIMQLHEFLGFMLFSSGVYTNDHVMFKVGIYFMQLPYVGKAVFHLLTCLERYLAVVHPITYMALKKPWGVRIRNVIIACVWLLSFGWLVFLSNIKTNLFNHFNICMSVFYVCVLSFISVLILCTLKHPGPGKVRINKSKRRAFNTIVAIMGVLLMRFGSILTVFVIMEIHPIQDVCVVTIGLGMWLEVPSSLVLPFLFLHRAGKLQCCR